MKIRKRLVFAIALLLVAALAVAWFTFRDSPRNGQLTLYGNVDIREVELAFRVPGRLAETAVDEGDRVSAGQRLARLDDEPYRESLAAAAARVRQAEAQLAKFEAGARPQEIRGARAELRAAQAAFDDAERDLARQSKLHEAGASSEKHRDAVRARRDAAAAQVDAARQRLALAEAGFRDEDIEAARAELAAARAQHEQAATALADTELRAPSDGVVLTRLREAGTILGPGTPVYSVSLRDPLYVRAYVDEAQLGRIVPGGAVTLTTDSSAVTYHGQVGFVSPRAEFTPRTVEMTALRTDLVYRLRIVVSDADDSLRQGMPVTVHVPAATASR